MVKGFELFQARLGSFEDAYVVIGGTACDLALKDFGGFRATKDIDMLIVTEHVDVTFAKALRDFLKEGSYTNMDEFIRHMDVLNPEWADVAAAVGPLALSPADYVERFRRLFAL